MTQKRAANLLVECLINQGVDKIYGVPGESYLSVLDALYDFNDKINFIKINFKKFGLNPKKILF